jgi:hypothetical protein
MIIILLLMLFSFTAHAKEATWLCSEEASQRQGNEVLSCGIGKGADENAARLAAFDNAKVEFNRVCTASADCQGHLVTVVPKRTVCEEKLGSFTCRRLLSFVLGAASGRQPSSESDNTPNLRTESFEPFIYSQTTQYPKVTPGMRKADLLKAFGAPASVGTLGFEGETKIFYYQGQMCSDKYSNGMYPNHCMVLVENNKVTKSENFDLRYTNDLE